MALGTLEPRQKSCSMALVDNRGQRLSSFGLAPICFGPGTGAEYEK